LSENTSGQHDEPELLRLAQAGDVTAIYNLGCLLSEKNPQQAQNWFEKGATLGDADSMNRLGLLLERDDPGSAANWYEMAAGLGDVRARYNLGQLLSPSERSLQLLREAAEDGHVSALVRVGQALESAEPDEALKYFKKAASTGDTWAELKVGHLLAKDDPAESRKYSNERRRRVNQRRCSCWGTFISGLISRRLFASLKRQLKQGTQLPCSI
jgi:TPR repeat protein